jgi:hypothetical protein
MQAHRQVDDRGMQRRWRDVGILAGVVIAACLAIAPIRSWRQVRAAQQAFDAGNISQKGLALRSLAFLRTRYADATILAALASPDPALRTHAGYAISSTHREDLAGELLVAWQRETDPAVRSGMIFDWSQLVGPTADEAVLAPMLASRDPWTLVAAARAKMRWGDIAAANQVLALAASADPALATTAQTELLYTTTPMAVMIGQALPVPDTRPPAWSAEQVGQFKDWWDAHITPPLLRDYAAWRLAKPAAWNKASLLLHTWRTHVRAFLPMTDAPEETVTDSFPPRRSP